MNDLDQIVCQVGIALKKLRKEAGYKSYEQFAFENNLSRIQYWKMESGNNFTIKSLINVLNIHNIELALFLVSLKSISPLNTTESIRLDKIIIHSGLNKRAFSERLGYKNANIINHILLGDRQISIPLAEKIVQHFPDINLAWILAGEGKFLKSTDQIL